MTSRFTPSRPASRTAHGTAPTSLPIQRPPTRDRDSALGTDRPLNLSGFAKKPGSGKVPGIGAASRAKVLQQMRPHTSDVSGVFKVPPQPSPSAASSAHVQEPEDPFAFMSHMNIRQPIPRPAASSSPPLEVPQDAPEQGDDSGYFSADTLVHIDRGSDEREFDHQRLSINSNINAIAQERGVSEMTHTSAQLRQDAQKDYHDVRLTTRSSMDAHIPAPVIDIDHIEEHTSSKRSLDSQRVGFPPREAKRRRSDQPQHSLFNSGVSSPASVKNAPSKPAKSPIQRIAETKSGILDAFDLSPAQMEHCYAIFQQSLHHWEEASKQEWRREADIFEKAFNKLVGMVVKRLTGSVMRYDDLKSHIAARQDELDQRDADLKASRFSLMRESGGVISSRSPSRSFDDFDR